MRINGWRFEDRNGMGIQSDASREITESVTAGGSAGLPVCASPLARPVFYSAVLGDFSPGVGHREALGGCVEARVVGTCDLLSIGYSKRAWMSVITWRS